MSEWLERESRGLSLVVVPNAGEAHALRAANWVNLCHRLGLHLPLAAALDFGVLFCERPLGAIQAIDSVLASRGCDAELQKRLRGWATLLRLLSESDVVLKCRGWRLSDEMVAVIIAKVFLPVFRNWALDERMALLAHSFPLVATSLQPSSLSWRFDRDDAAYFTSFYSTALASELQIRHAVEQLDVDTLRLLGLFRPNADAHAALELVDLFGLFSMPMVNDIVNFSLQLMPSVLESTRKRDAQTASMDGFEGIERSGQIDSLLLSEMAYDDDLFEQKVIDNELYFYTRTRAREEEKKLHLLLIDASASMRGRRSVFARGVALAMIKKLLLQGERPVLRFFDSQLYEPIELNAGFSVPYLLAFQSERGRNYHKVFEQLLADLRREATENQAELMVYLFTHGQCHIPNETVLRLRELAHLFGIFILPGEKLDIDYGELLHRIRIVGEDALRSAANRKHEALSILENVGGRNGSAS